MVTTAGGLYRYAMNDLVEVTGVHRATPLLRFVQKGRGVTNLTGEKLYEAQVIEAVQAAAAAHGRHPPFFLMVADEAAPGYRLFVETDGPVPSDLCTAFADAVDAGLAAGNLDTRRSATAADCRCRRSPGSVPAPERRTRRRACAPASARARYKPAVLVYEREMKLPAATLAAFAGG